MLVVIKTLFANYNITQLFSFFIIYSCFGWLLESINVSIRRHQIINSGFLYGPFCPIYGFGSLFLILFVSSFQNVFSIFIVGFFIISVWEYYVSVAMEKVFGFKWWDYSRYRFNLHGRINLIYSLIWGILGVILIKVIHPFILNFYLDLNFSYLNSFITLFFIYILLDAFLTIMKVLEIKKLIVKPKNIIPLFSRNKKK